MKVYKLIYWVSAKFWTDIEYSMTFWWGKCSVFYETAFVIRAIFGARASPSHVMVFQPPLSGRGGGRTLTWLHHDDVKIWREVRMRFHKMHCFHSIKISCYACCHLRTLHKTRKLVYILHFKIKITNAIFSFNGENHVQTSHVKPPWEIFNF